jgi:hypothetical protein
VQRLDGVGPRHRDRGGRNRVHTTTQLGWLVEAGKRGCMRVRRISPVFACLGGWRNSRWQGSTQGSRSLDLTVCARGRTCVCARAQRFVCVCARVHRGVCARTRLKTMDNGGVRGCEVPVANHGLATQNENDSTLEQEGAHAHRGGQQHLQMKQAWLEGQHPRRQRDVRRRGADRLNGGTQGRHVSMARRPSTTEGWGTRCSPGV